MTFENNRAKGQTSFDSTSTGQLVEFINRNSSTYPTEVGGPKFDLVNVTDQKDLMINVARLQAQQEYDRIMEVVAVLQKQANDIKKRLDLTEMIHRAKYNFQVRPGQAYWLLIDKRKNETRLSMMGPTDWSAGCPDHYEYISKVLMLGDSTWAEVKE